MRTKASNFWVCGFEKKEKSAGRSNNAAPMTTHALEALDEDAHAGLSD